MNDNTPDAIPIQLDKLIDTIERLPPGDVMMSPAHSDTNIRTDDLKSLVAVLFSLIAERDKYRAALERIRDGFFMGGRDVAAEIAGKALKQEGDDVHTRSI